MEGKKKMRIFYRAAGHLPLWKVMEEGGFLEKHGLEIDLGSMQGLREKASEGLRTGQLDVISGNHHNLYAPRALKGVPFVYLAQPDDDWGGHWMVAGKGIKRIDDLKGKRVCMGDFDGHTGLNVWLYLHLHGLEEGRDVELVTAEGEGGELIRKVMAGEYDATFVGCLDQMRAKAMGADVIEVPTMPMIGGVTITTTTNYVKNHEEEVRRLLCALVDAIHFFKTRRQETLGIMSRTCSDALEFQSEKEMEAYYEEQALSFEKKPYPTMDAIRNVFALAVKRNPEISGFNPLVLWDLHYLRELDDSGYIDQLYE